MALVQYDLDSSSDSDAADEDSKTSEFRSFVDSQKRSLKVAKGNKKIKIAIPKINEYDKNDDDPSEISAPKFTSNADLSENSGLFLKLPPPRMGPSKKITTTSFVPHSVNRKPLAKAKRQKVEQKTDLSSLDDDDEESDDDLASTPTNFDEEMWSQVCGRRPKNAPAAKNIEINLNPVIAITDVGASTEKPPQLDNDAFKKLVGSSKRLLPTDVTITDIAEADILEKTDVWMRKALTDPQYQQKSTPTTEDDDSSNPVARNKHHITYLAQQAKAKEQELQAQWASGNQKRQMSRAKYGF